MQKLFTYGTLQYKTVQIMVFKRVAELTADTLEDYSKEEIVFGTGATYPIIIPQAGSRVQGYVIEVSDDELALIDRYETSAYRRIQVTLKSGSVAWVYCQPTNSD